MNPNHKGNVAELAIAAEAAKNGIDILRPMTEHARYDLVFDIAGLLLRVQCKSASQKGDVIAVRLRSSYHSPTRGYVTSTYTSAEVDAVAVYCEDLDRCYLIPIAVAAGRGMLHLRLCPARNSQRAALHFADEYAFRGAVAQLAERFAGSEEARGSNPLSSTLEGAPAAPSLVVGAHEFRNRFGYYLEQASGGGEIHVTRRGRPYARLCPPV